MSQTIFVTGDWVADWHLARPANLPEGYFDGSLQTQLYHRPGGAWYVAHLIENVSCRDLTGARSCRVAVKPLRDPDESIPGLDGEGRQRNDLAHAYSIWWKHQRLRSGKKDDQVWRIGRFAGCRKSTTWKPPPSKKGASSGALIVVDDLGLGFSEQPSAVRHVISHAGLKGKILLKHGVRAHGSGILLKLLEKNLDDRLHVVTAAGALRRRNAAISRGLSWDRTLEDIEAEFKSGPSSRDLARCATAVVHFGLAGAAVFHGGKLHRFIFLPDELEGIWEDERPGGHFGTASVLTASIARHLINQDNYPLFFAVTQALAAQRVAHEQGAGKEKNLDIDLPYGQRKKICDPKNNPAAACIAAPPRSTPGKKVDPCVECIKDFRAAWDPSDIRVWPEATAPSLKRFRLLCNVTGTTPDSLRAKAFEVVIQGTKNSLASVPKACYEKYLTADRDEIESINEIRRLILEYKMNPHDKRPLSIAVFGAPGSGKSFAIKEVAKALFGKDKESLEFNLSQIKTPEDLHRAFNQVRDASIRLEIPLVFWDEFDTGALRWLADFLAPMQDAEFFDGSHRHPFGKCVFVFAGGTRISFGDFKKWYLPDGNEKWAPTPEQPWHQSFKDRKGPDFVSRLRGFVNVKGPNPTPEPKESTHDAAILHGPSYVLRRALILRSEIERNFPHLIDDDTKRAAIAPNVLHALLAVECYEHGSRSISALLSMCAINNAKAFTVSALPADDLLHLHVSRDFREKLADPVTSSDLHDRPAMAGFEAWKAQKIHQGYTYGPIRNDGPQKPLTHPLIKDWGSLTANEKASNYDPIWRRLIAIRRVGWDIAVRVDHHHRLPKARMQDLISRLLAPEHEIWLADHLTTGYHYAKKTIDHLRLHADIQPFDSLPTKQRDLNRSIVTDTLKAIERAGFCFVEEG